MFHIDFGYVFGDDPKMYPPPMRITKEMVEGMGGLSSSNYKKFLRTACQVRNTHQPKWGGALC